MSDIFLLIMGVQGSGKGTQANFITETHKIPHVSTGDLFRAMRTRTDPLANRIRETLAAGLLVDDATTNEVLKDKLDSLAASGQRGALMDGYPRNHEQSEFLTAYLACRCQKINASPLQALDTYNAV